MKLELLQLLSKTRVPRVPSTKTPVNTSVYKPVGMEQVQNHDLFRLFHGSQNNEYGTNGTNSSNALVPLRHEKKTNQNNALQGMEQMEHRIASQ